MVEKISTVFVRRDYDLRQPLEVKLADVHKLAACTVLLNRRHNLAHVFWAGEQEAWLRLPVPKGVLKGTSDHWVDSWFKKRLGRWL